MVNDGSNERHDAQQEDDKRKDRVDMKDDLNAGNTEDTKQGHCVEEPRESRMVLRER